MAKKYRAEIVVMPLRELLDPQGKAVKGGLDKLGFKLMNDVRVGKHIHIELEAPNENDARNQVEQACKKLLANPVIEYFEFTLHPLN